MNGSVVLPPEPEEIEAALAQAAGAEPALRELVTRWPTCIEGWAGLSEAAYESGDDVASYAYARVGYHRGLDRMRASGWRPGSTLGAEHPSNRGFLHALFSLMRAAAAIGEGVEARRCREFLLELDPSDHFGVAGIRPADLGRRLQDGRAP